MSYIQQAGHICPFTNAPEVSTIDIFLFHLTAKIAVFLICKSKCKKKKTCSTHLNTLIYKLEKLQF